MKKSILLLLLLFTVGFGSQDLSNYVQLIHTEEPSLLKEGLENSIKEAKKSIVMMAFSFSDPEMMQAINQKANEGLDITLIIDKDHLGPVTSLGHPNIHIYTRREGEGHLHHKVLVTDEENVWIGSANFTTSAYSPSQQNLMAYLKSPTIAKALVAESCQFYAPKARLVTPPPVSQYQEQTVELFLLPACDPKYQKIERQINQVGKKKLLSLIAGAKSHIRIAMMTWSDPDLENAVLAAHKRGVLVEVIVDNTDVPIFQKLKKENALIFKNHHIPLLHHKWMMVDDQILVNGSANWSRSAFTRNDENFIIISPLTEEQKNYLESHWDFLISY